MKYFQLQYAYLHSIQIIFLHLVQILTNGWLLFGKIDDQNLSCLFSKFTEKELYYPLPLSLSLSREPEFAILI